MLKISFSPAATKTKAALVLFIAQNAKLSTEAAKIDQGLGGAIVRAIVSSTTFKGKKGQTLLLPAPHAEGPSHVLLVGLGETAKVDTLVLETLGATLATTLSHAGEKTAVVLVETLKGIKIKAAEAAAHIGHGAQLRTYRFEKYKAPKKVEDRTVTLEALTLAVPDGVAAKHAFSALEAVSQGVTMARDLGHEPPNVLTPTVMAEATKSLSKLGVKVQILDEKQMKALGMGSLLAVAQGSATPARMAIMRWNGDAKAKDKRPLALIGKGVTFDSGGISLKPGAGMDEMKFDMLGAAAVIGTMKALALRKAKVNVVGLVGLVENMPSGNALRPGDIITAGSGQTIEVLNTDAEGRLVLADVMWYAQKHFKPHTMIDLATLTGAILISFGHEYAGLFTNNDKLAERLTKAGHAIDEPLWRMPLCKTFDKMMDSTIADLRNFSGSREAGSCTAAQFLQRFVEKDVAWAHLDIAGTAWIPKDKDLAPKGPTAFGVRLLNRLIADNFEA